MALIKFELKEEHLKLLKHLSNWALDASNSIFCETENKTPYGGLSLIEDAGLILYGKPEKEFDPLSPYNAEYTEEQIEEIDKLYDELPTALDIVCFHLPQATEVGYYKTRWHQRNWKKYTPKT